MAAPELIALLTCDATAADPHGKITLYGLFDVIWATQFPMRHPQLAVFLKCRFPGPGEAQVLLESPEGEPLLALAPVRAAAAGSVQVVYQLTNVEFPGPGVYHFRLLSSGGAVGAVPLEVRTRQ
ncbi:MAG: hypothetical protein U0807_12965 [Candidatus Binatia bacterium]